MVGTWKLFILHSLVSTEEQQSIFMQVEDARKIILSTNIAESSITVPDVEFGKLLFCYRCCIHKSIRISAYQYKCIVYVFFFSLRCR